MTRVVLLGSILLLAGCGRESAPTAAPPDIPPTPQHRAIERAQSVERQTMERNRRQLDSADRASE